MFVPSEEQLNTTNKAYELRASSKNDIELSALFGISKHTLYTRLEVSNWKVAEIVLINFLHKQYKNETK